MIAKWQWQLRSAHNASFESGCVVCGWREMHVLYFVGPAGHIRVCTCKSMLYRATRMDKS